MIIQSLSNDAAKAYHRYSVMLLYRFRHTEVSVQAPPHKGSVMMVCMFQHTGVGNVAVLATQHGGSVMLLSRLYRKYLALNTYPNHVMGKNVTSTKPILKTRTSNRGCSYSPVLILKQKKTTIRTKWSLKGMRQDANQMTLKSTEIIRIVIWIPNLAKYICSHPKSPEIVIISAVHIYSFTTILLQFPHYWYPWSGFTSHIIRNAATKKHHLTESH